MDFSFSEDQQALRELARKILSDLATQERIRAVEKGQEWIDRELWGELARAQLLGAALPEAHGGMGQGFGELCLLLEEQGRAVAPLPLHATLLPAFALSRSGSAAQQERWLPRVVEGEAILALGLADEGSDDLSLPTTTARRDGSGWRLDGTKINVSAAGIAERVLVTARTERGETAAFLVDPRGAGLRLERQVATHREPVWWVTLDGARVPEEDRVALDASWLAQRAVTALCAIQLGVSERALEMTAEYGRTRQQFDRPIGSFQAFHTRAGDAYVNLEALRLSFWQAASRLERDQPAEEDVLIAKFWACEGGQFVGYAAQHLHGGIGMDIDYPLHRYYMWAKHLELSLGSSHRALARLGAAAAAL